MGSCCVAYDRLEARSLVFVVVPSLSRSMPVVGGHNERLVGSREYARESDDAKES